jgi:hypothetical protein
MVQRLGSRGGEGRRGWVVSPTPKFIDKKNLAIHQLAGGRNLRIRIMTEWDGKRPYGRTALPPILCSAARGVVGFGTKKLADWWIEEAAAAENWQAVGTTEHPDLPAVY